MNAGLDTSVVVRLLVGEPKEQAAIGWQFLEECQSTGTRAHVCELVVAESFFVLQHHYGVPLSATLQQLAALLTDPRVIADASVLKVLGTPNLAAAKPGFVDRLIHGLYQAQGESLVTFDNAAACLPNTRVLTS